MFKLSVVAFVGNLRDPSRTGTLVGAYSAEERIVELLASVAGEAGSMCSSDRLPMGVQR